MINRVLGGALPDIPSDRDYPARDLLAGIAPVSLPDEFEFVKDSVVLDQGSTLQCVAYSGTGTQIDELKALKLAVPPFDIDSLYSVIKQPMGGAYPRDLCNTMLNNGMPVYGRKPTCWDKIIHNNIESAFDPAHKIEGYYRITRDMSDDEIDTILYSFGTIIIACGWPDNWMNKFDVFPVSSRRISGGHCVRMNAFNRKTRMRRVVNSWGKILWGNGGIAWIPNDIFRATFLEEGDCWKIVNVIP